MGINNEKDRNTEFIGVLQQEKMKTRSVLDANERVLIVYEAPAHVKDGEPCLATLYEYDPMGGNSPQIRKTHEKEAVWDSAWDVTDQLVNGEVGYTEP